MSTKTNPNTPERLALSVRDVAELLGISTRHCWKLAASGRLPQPIRLGRSVRWIYTDILAHLESLKRDGAGGPR